jgi:hypothetical protein
MVGGGMGIGEGGIGGGGGGQLPHFPDFGVRWD